MSKYYDNLDKLRKKHFKVLSPTFPEWLLEYEEAKIAVEDYLNLKRSKYTGFDFEFKPY